MKTMRNFKLMICSFRLWILVAAMFLIYAQPVAAMGSSDDSLWIDDPVLEIEFWEEKPGIVSADTVPPYYYRINGTYLRTYWDDFKYVATSPLHWKGRQWAKFGAIVGTAGLVMLTLDEPVQQMMLRNQGEAYKSASKVLYPLGNRFPPLLLTGLYLTGVVTHNRRLEHASLSVAKSLAIATIFYTASKSVIRRQRPTRTDDPYDFVPPFSKKGYTSFPSGHTNTAFAVATAFALEYNDKKWVPWVAYTLASLTAVSRVYDNRHWFSDIIIGASVGHFVTKMVYKQEYKRRAAGRINLKGI